MSNQHIFTPGQLLANVPGSMGFYPTESIIIMGFEAKGEPAQHDGAMSLTLGPTVRIDIDDFDELKHDLARALEPLATELVFAFIVSQRPERLLDDVAQELYNYGETCGLNIDACWYVPEIKQGQPYELWFGRDLSTSGTAGTAWMGGTVPPIINSPSMESYVDRGELPDINRNEAIRPLTDRNTAFSREEAADMGRIATTLSQALGNGERFVHGEHHYGIEDIVDDVQLFLTEHSLSHDTTNLDLDLDLDLDPDFDKDPQQLITAGMWLATSQTRDLVLSEFIDNPVPAAEVLLVIARTFSGEIRANALSIYAATQVAMNQSHRAGLALTCLMQENPDHRLGSLLYQLYSIGRISSLVDAAAEGSRIAQDVVLRDVEKKRQRAQRKKRKQERSARKRAEGRSKNSRSKNGRTNSTITAA